MSHNTRQSTSGICHSLEPSVLQLYYTCWSSKSTENGHMTENLTAMAVQMITLTKSAV